MLNEIEIGNTREGQKRRTLDEKLAESTASIVQKNQEFLNEQLAQNTKVEVPAFTSSSRRRALEMVKEQEELEAKFQERFTQRMSEIVLESLWIDADVKEQFTEKVQAATKDMMDSLFTEGAITIQSALQSDITAVQIIAEDVIDTLKEEDAVEGQDSKDAKDVVVSNVMEKIKEQIAAEKEIAETNQAAEEELSESDFQVFSRPEKRQSPTLWSAIVTDMSRKTLNESGEWSNEAIADSLVVMTILETVNTLGLIDANTEFAHKFIEAISE